MYTRATTLFNDLTVAYSDFATLIRLCDANAALCQVSILHQEAWLCFSGQSVTHVKRDDLSSISGCEATHTGCGVGCYTSTLPLAYVNFEVPNCAFVQHKCAYVKVIISPRNKKQANDHWLVLPGPV